MSSAFRMGPELADADCVISIDYYSELLNHESHSPRPLAAGLIHNAENMESSFQFRTHVTFSVLSRGEPIMLAILVLKGTKYACNLDHVGDQICLQSRTFLNSFNIAGIYGPYQN